MTNAVRPLIRAEVNTPAAKARRHRVMIEDAALLACRADQQAVVILSVGRDGRLSTVCYGETLAKYAAIQPWAQAIAPVMFDAELFSRVFGTDANGHPRALSPEAFAALPPAARDHATRTGGEPC